MTPHLSVGRTVCTTRTVMLRDSAAGLELRNSERNSFPKQKARVYTRARPAADPGHADGLNRFQRGTVRIADRAVLAVHRRAAAVRMFLRFFGLRVLASSRDLVGTHGGPSTLTPGELRQAPDRECWPSSPGRGGSWLSFFASPVHDVPSPWFLQCLAPMRLVCSISPTQPVP